MPRRLLILSVILLSVALLAVSKCLIDDSSEGGYPAITFLGGAREVGGSCYLVDTGRTKFIVDCGEMGSPGSEVPPREAEDIDFALLTHSHSDHCGLIPELFGAGFRGKVYCSYPTAGLTPVMLSMSRGFKREKIPRDDFHRALSSLEGVEFGKWTMIQDVSFRFRRAGHLLGAAFIEVVVGNAADSVRIVFSGDLGSGNSVLLRPLEYCFRADYVVMESTYGGTVRGDHGKDAIERHYPFASSVGKALLNGGDVLIPAFTLGRTQEVIAVIDYYRDLGVIPDGAIVYSDSPTAEKITEIYREFEGELRRNVGDSYGDGILRRSTLREVKSSSSLKVHDRKHRPSIFISSSGNLDYANSPRHLMKMFSERRNLLCLVGWQPPGSVGRRLSNGEKAVRIRYRDGKEIKREWISPALAIRQFHSFSGHADQKGLLKWISAIEGVRKVFLVHGEADQAEGLQKEIIEELGHEVIVPERNARFILGVRSFQRHVKSLMAGETVRV